MIHDPTNARIPVHHLTHDQIMSGLVDGQMKIGIGLGFMGGIIQGMGLFHGLDTGAEPGQIRLGGPLGRQGGGVASHDAAEFKIVEDGLGMRLEQMGQGIGGRRSGGGFGLGHGVQDRPRPAVFQPRKIRVDHFPIYMSD